MGPDNSDRSTSPAPTLGSEESFRLLVESVKDYGIFMLDPKGHVASWNAGAERMYGNQTEEIIGRHLSCLYAPESVQCGLPEAELAAAERDGQFEGEGWRVRKDGSRFFANVVCTALRDRDGTLRGFAKVTRDLTERRHAEEARRASNAASYARSLIEASLDPLVTISAEGKITDVNSASVQATGVPRERLIGTDFCDYFTEPQKAREGYRRVFSEGFVCDYPLAIRHVSGRVMDVLYNASLYRDETGVVQGVFAAARDVTERKRAEMVVQAERQRFSDVLDNLPAYLALLSPDYRMPFANRFFRERFGDSNGRRCYEFLFDRTEPCEICETFKVFETHQPLRWEWTGPDERIYDISDFPFTDTDGSSLVMEVGLDITLRKRAEEEMRTRARQQAAAAELGGRALRATSLQDLMDEVARTVAAALGAEMCDVLEVLPGGQGLALRAGIGWKDGLIGVARIAADADSQAGYTLMSKAPVIVADLLTETRFRGPSLLVDHGVVSGMSVIIGDHDRPFGLLCVHARQRRTFSEGDVNFLQAVANLLADAATRQRAEEEIRTLNAELEARVAQRTAQLEEANRELESFSYSVSHDLRAPLRAMSGFSQAVVEDYGDRLPAEAHTYLGQITAASRHMGQLIDGLLTLSRSTRGALHRERVDLSAISDQVRRELEQAEPARLVEWDIEPGLVALADSATIEVVLRNLIDNAWKYTARTPAPVIRVFAERDGGDQVFCVADNGAGFNMDYAERLFQPFQRLHRQDEFPGIGIGLATAQRIVHRHGGTIGAKATVGGGATFRFSLPLQEGKNREAT